MSDITALESKTYVEYCSFLERYLEKVEAHEEQMRELKENSGSKKAGKRTSRT